MGHIVSLFGVQREIKISFLLFCLVMLCTCGRSEDVVQEADGQGFTFSALSGTLTKGTHVTPEWWNKISTRFKKTPLGHPVATTCHNCYRDTVGNKDLSLAEANTKINDAIESGANLIEIDLAFDDQRELCAYHGDPSTCDVDGGNSAPRFRDLLDNEVLQKAQTLLFIEIKENTKSEEEQEEFAKTMLDEIVSRGATYVNEERPVIFLGRTSNIQVMKTLQRVSNDANYEEYRDFMKFGLLFYSTSQSEIESYANDPDFQMDLIDFDYSMTNVMMMTDLAQSLGLVVGYFTFYSPAYIATLREEADIITTEYEMTDTLEVIEESNVMAFLDVSHCGSKDDSSVSMSFSIKGQKILRNPVEMIIDLAQSVLPTLMDGDDELGYVSCYLSFESSHQNLIHLGQRNPRRDEGVLVTAYVSFEDLTEIPEGTMVIVGNGSKDGFSLELVRESDETFLRFGVHIDGEFVYDSVNVAETGISGFSSLNTHTPYLIMGGYDGGGGVYLFINNKYNTSTSRSRYSSSMTSSNLPMLIGAGPKNKKKSRYYFDGGVQKVMVLSWKDR